MTVSVIRRHEAERQRFANPSSHKCASAGCTPERLKVAGGTVNMVGADHYGRDGREMNADEPESGRPVCLRLLVT
jgi:hypothetical protein